MSTVKYNHNASANSTLSSRLAKINQIDSVIFHIDDLANLWGIRSANTLHTTMKRYAQSGLFFRIYRGLYSLKPQDKIDPFLLGIKALHEFAYISTETILVQSGVMFQQVFPVTLISGKSKRFKVGSVDYLSRQLADEYLYNSIGIEEVDGVRRASLSRAVADLLYYNPNIYFDAPELINWREVRRLQKNIGYPLTPNRYDFTKSKRGQA